MAFTIKGTYTKNRGDQAAAGTVEVFSKRGVSLDEATLDENGSYELTIDAQEGEVKVVETITGVEERSYEVSVSRGSITDTSRDIGYVGPEAPSDAYVLPDPLPEVPATPDAQDVVDALVTLGLVTQAEA